MISPRRVCGDWACLFLMVSVFITCCFRHAFARSRRRWAPGLPSGPADRPEPGRSIGLALPQCRAWTAGYGIMPASG